MSLLRELHANGCLRAIDHALAMTLHRLDAATPDAVLAAAALASRVVAEGHSGLCVDAVATFLDVIAPQRAVIEWPDTQAWLSMLRASRWVADADVGASAAGVPLVLERGRLYLRRYWNYEVRLAHALRQRAVPPAIPGDTEALRARLAELFADADPTQTLAALLALSSRLALITGGPGTGKTRTVAALLVLLHEQAIRTEQRPPRIVLAAPTGKAAARLSEALGERLEGLREAGRIDATLAQTLRIPAQTLHRLLGWRPDSVRFRHDAAHPLRADVVVVDEASMVDLPLMCKLVEAVAPEAKLLLLGDRDQLASVEAGDVLAALCDAAGDGRAFPSAFANAATALIGAPVPVRCPGIASNSCAAIASTRVWAWRRSRPRCVRATPRRRSQDCARSVSPGCTGSPTANVRCRRGCANRRCLRSAQSRSAPIPHVRCSWRECCAFSPPCAKARPAARASTPGSRTRCRPARTPRSSTGVC
jgi:exodeoxyribonuclease V alpha subunit